MTVRALASALLRGERAALARGITLVESRAPRMRAAADALLEAALNDRQAQNDHAAGSGVARVPSLRIGISGPPGAGKSTLIEALGEELIGRGHKLAALAVDPSSHISGGSILGDKTRMPKLSANRSAYIRPSPSRGELGGVARRTEDAILLCECAGYDRIIVETVGVGQSEVAVARMCDVFMLLVPPGGGDELQGIKRGIMELCDIVVVTKADGALRRPARDAARQLKSALQVMRPKHPAWSTPVLEVSSVEHAESGIEEVARQARRARRAEGRPSGDNPPPPLPPQEQQQPVSSGRAVSKPALGAADVADSIEAFREAMEASGGLIERRKAQAASAVRAQAWSSLRDARGGDEVAAAMVEAATEDVAHGRLAASAAGARVARRILEDAARRAPLKG